jgi:hypothetical protein
VPGCSYDAAAKDEYASGLEEVPTTKEITQSSTNGHENRTTQAP